MPARNRGEVIARSQTDVPGRLETLKQAQAQLADGSDVAGGVERAWVTWRALGIEICGCRFDYGCRPL